MQGRQQIQFLLSIVMKEMNILHAIDRSLRLDKYLFGGLNSRVVKIFTFFLTHTAPRGINMYYYREVTTTRLL